MSEEIGPAIGTGEPVEVSLKCLFALGDSACNKSVNDVIRTVRKLLYLQTVLIDLINQTAGLGVII